VAEELAQRGWRLEKVMTDIHCKFVPIAPSQTGRLRRVRSEPALIRHRC
jgi:hypothetical protein